MNNQSGYVYLLKNEAMPGIYKIGMTNREVDERVKELSLSTSVPLPFEVVCSVKVDDALDAEYSFHEMFSEFRINQNREFFKFDDDILKEVIGRFADITFNQLEEGFENFQEIYSHNIFKNKKDELLKLAERLFFPPVFKENGGHIENSELLTMLNSAINNNGEVIVPIITYEVCLIDDYRQILKNNIDSQFLTDYIEKIPRDNDPFELHKLLDEIKTEWGLLYE